MQHIARPAADAVSAIEAVVHAGATETHYRRAGRGPAVLLLFPRGASDPDAARLFDRLARRFRVIAPVPPAAVVPAPRAEGERAPLSGWLRDLIDGLGLAQPAIVVDASLAAAALAFARTDPDRAGALAAVSRGSTDSIDAIDAIDGTGGSTDGAEYALHVFRDGAPGAMDAMIAFLEAEAMAAVS